MVRVPQRTPEIAARRTWHPTRFPSVKLLPRVPSPGGLLPGCSGMQNGIDEILGLESAALIKHRGAYGTRHPVWVLGRGLRSTPLWGRGAGAGWAGTQGAVLGLGRWEPRARRWWRWRRGSGTGRCVGGVGTGALALGQGRWMQSGRCMVRGQQRQGRCLAAHQRPAGKRQDRGQGTANRLRTGLSSVPGSAYHHVRQ